MRSKVIVDAPKKLHGYISSVSGLKTNQNDTNKPFQQIQLAIYAKTQTGDKNSSIVMLTNYILILLLVRLHLN